MECGWFIKAVALSDLTGEAARHVARLITDLEDSRAVRKEQQEKILALMGDDLRDQNRDAEIATLRAEIATLRGALLRWEVARVVVHEMGQATTSDTYRAVISDVEAVFPADLGHYTAAAQEGVVQAVGPADAIRGGPREIVRAADLVQFWADAWAAAEKELVRLQKGAK